MVAGPLADGLVEFLCSQGVSEPDLWLPILVLMIFLLSVSE